MEAGMYMKTFTFNALVSSFALRANLTTLSSFILIASPTNRENTFITGNKELHIYSYLNHIPTNLTYLPTQFFCGLYLKQNVVPSTFKHKRQELNNYKPIAKQKDCECLLEHVQDIAKFTSTRVQTGKHYGFILKVKMIQYKQQLLKSKL